MGFFNIRFNKVVWETLPVDERTPVRFAWLKALITPIKSIYKAFTTFRNANIYKLTHNGQVCYLEAALNDVFDKTHRRIYIDKGAVHYVTYLFLDAELKPKYINLDSEVGAGVIDEPDPVPLWLDSEVEENAVRFIVWVPAGLVFDEAKMVALIDAYRLASINIYAIETY